MIWNSRKTNRAIVAKASSLIGLGMPILGGRVGTGMAFTCLGRDSVLFSQMVRISVTSKCLGSRRMQ